MELTQALHPATSPPYCGASGDLELVLTNLLSTDITSATISGTYNGGTPPFPAFNYAPGSPLASGQSDTVLIAPAVAPVDGDVIELFITDVNGGATQDDITNDTLSFTVQYAMSGTYVVGPSGTADYPDLGAAFADVESLGLCGATTLEHESGTFAEQADLTGPVAGLNAANRLTVTSQTGNAADVVLTQNATTDADNRVLRFDNISYTTVSNLTFEDVETGATASEHSRLVEFLSNNVSNEVRNNVFIGDSSTLVEDNTDFAEDLVLLHLEQNVLADSIQIIGNEFYGGSRAIFNDGPFGDSTVAANIEDNLFENYGYKAIEIDDNRNFVVNNNTFRITNGFVDGTAIEAEDFENGTITNNRIYSPNRGIGMDIDDAFTSTGGQNLIANNVINLGQNGATTGSDGIYINDGDNIFVYHNTVRLYGATATTAEAFYLGFGVANAVVQNNNFVVEGTDGFAMEISDALNITSSDYNNIYVTHANDHIEFDATDYNTLAAYQGGSSQDVNAVAVDPLFADAPNNDLSVCNDTLLMANPIASITTDIAGTARDASTPTAGGYELSLVPPAAPFLGNDTTICAGDPVDIIAPVGNFTYTWNNIPADTNQQTVNTAGQYILDISSACGTSIDTLEVQEFATATAGFTFVQGATKYDYDFTNTSSGDGLSFSWDFGDGSPASTLADPSHTYASIGTYIVELTVTDTCGSLALTFTDTIVIDCDPLNAAFTSAQGATALDYDFFDGSTGDVQSWAWDFGDGNTDNIQNPSHSYTAAGTYNVQLTVTDSCGNTAVATDVLTAGSSCDTLVVDFTSAQGATKYDYDFTDASTGSIDTTGASTAYDWDFGDGNTSADRNPSHTYSGVGTYTVTLTVTDSCGNSDLSTQTVTIDCDPLTASFTSAQGATNLDYDFTDASTGDVESWAWDFGDSNTDNVQNPSHSYAAAGTYTVELIATDSCGNTDTSSITVNAGITCGPLVVDFTSAQGATKYDYDFTDASTGSIDTTGATAAYDWDFGDGNTSTLQDPSHTYSSIGTYTVTLTVTDSCGNSDISTQTVTIDCDPLNAAFTSAQGATNLDYDFTDASTGDVESLGWDFGDGNTDNVQNPSNSYAAAGTYTVTLTVTDSCGNTDVFTETINAGISCDPLTASFTSNVNQLDVDFTNTSTGSIDTSPASTAFDWDFGDGIGTSTDQDPSYSYGTDGSYTVTLTVTDSCGNTDTFTEVVIVSSGSGGCPPFNLEFLVEQIAGNQFAFSYDGDNVGYIDSYSWTVDGQTFTGDSISYTFPDTGTYDIELIVSDTCGNSDTVSKTLTVQIDSRADLIDAGLNIYPNPASDFVTLTFETPVNGGEVQIYNMTGQLIQRESLTAMQTAYTLQLQDVSEGVYLIRVTEQGTSMSERKLIIRR